MSILNITRVKTDVQKDRIGAMMVVCGDIPTETEKKIMSEVRFSSERLAKLMDKHGLSDQDLADKTGIGKTTIYYLRRGRKGKTTSTSAENIDILADALKTSTDYLIEKTEDPSPVKKKISALVADIVGIAEELSPAKQRQLRELGNTLVKMDRTTDVAAVYNELMDLISRLTTMKGGNKAIADLASYINSLSSQPHTTTPAPRRRRPRKRDSESSDEPTQGAK